MRKTRREGEDERWLLGWIVRVQSSKVSEQTEHKGEHGHQDLLLFVLQLIITLEGKVNLNRDSNAQCKSHLWIFQSQGR